MHNYVKRVTTKASKLSNEQIEHLLNSVIQENEELNSMFESLSNGIIVVDNNFCIKQINNAAYSYFSFSVNRDEINSSLLNINEILEDDEIRDYLLNCKEKDITNSSEEFSLSTSGGSVRFVNIIISPLLKNNAIEGKIILVNDITDKKNHDVILHRMENLANLTNLAAGMAHEIKNPLGAISIHIQLIQKGLEKARDNNDILPPRKFIEDHIDIVNKEIDHLNNLVMDFLFAVRPVNATLELKNPTIIINGIVEFIKPEFNKEKISVFFNYNDIDKKLLIDEKLFREVIMNISQNALFAIKSRLNTIETATDEGQFSIECKINANKYYINLTDNGCGMDETTLSKIFEPYYTTKANGTGLGMTMVYKIVKEFSGEILVKSEKNKGTSFTLIFPLPQKDKKLIS
jgi:two-component system, sporulation sensor kinase E